MVSQSDSDSWTVNHEGSPKYTNASISGYWRDDRSKVNLSEFLRESSVKSFLSRQFISPPLEKIYLKIIITYTKVGYGVPNRIKFCNRRKVDEKLKGNAKYEGIIIRKHL